MKTLLILSLLALPMHLWAQIETLKPIGTDLVPVYGSSRYGYGNVRSQYTYDGLDIKPKALGQYIMASDNSEAIREFTKYMNSRQAGGWMIAGGIVTATVGLIVGVSSDHSGEASKGSYSSGGVVSGGSICYGYCNPVPDRTNQSAVKAGVTTFFSGLIVAAIGGLMLRPGPHLRHAVQYYNRDLKQRGISWQLTPYSTVSSSGIGLAGRF